MSRYSPRKFDTLWTLERGEGDAFDVRIDYTMTPVIPAQTSGPAEGCYPAEGGEIEIQSVTDHDGGEVTLTDAEESHLLDWLSQNTDWSRYDRD